MSQDKLMPCPDCGSECRVENFGNDQEVALWLCSNHTMFGGKCPSDMASFSAEIWNRLPTTDVSTDGLVERLLRTADLLEVGGMSASCDELHEIAKGIEALERSNAEKDEALRNAWRWASCMEDGQHIAAEISKALSHSSETREQSK